MFQEIAVDFVLCSCTYTFFLEYIKVSGTINIYSHFVISKVVFIIYQNSYYTDKIPCITFYILAHC